MLALLTVVAFLHLRGARTLADGAVAGPKPPPATGEASRRSGANPSAWQRRWWIDKTAKLLRGGEGLGPDDAVDALLPLSKEEIARRFMQDKRFGDSILDFNLFFLGFKSDRLKTDGVYDRTVFDFPNAVAAAQALLSGGDYFTLFDLEGPYFMAPLRSEPSEEQLQPADGVSRRRSCARRRWARSRRCSPMPWPSPPPSRRLAWRRSAPRSRRSADSEQQLMPQLHRAFDDAEIFALIRGEVVSGPLDVLAKIAEKACDDGVDPECRRKTLIDGLQARWRRVQARVRRDRRLRARRLPARSRCPSSSASIFRRFPPSRNG